MSQIGINTPIHFVIGTYEFTDKDIQEWARGNIENIDWPRWMETTIIRCLSQVIVEYQEGE